MTIAARMEGSESFNTVATSILESQADHFAGAMWKTTENERPWIQFKGAAPEDAKQLIQSLPYEVDIREDAVYSLSDQNAITQDTTAWLEDSYPEAAVSFSFDEDNSAIELNTDSPALVGALAERTLPENLESQARTAPGDEALTADVPVIATLEDSLGSAEVLSGGATMSNKCTAGFTVRNNRTGATGITTASHCDDDLNYEGRNILRFEGHGDGVRLDMQWFSSSESVWDQFIFNKAKQRLEVAGTQIAQPGTYICKWGFVGLDDCAAVYKRGVSTNYNNTSPLYNNMTAMVGYISEGGDSGGPYYQALNGGGAWAIGMHGGWELVDNVKRSIYSEVRIMQSLTDLRVIY
jgi:streptogrisin C